MTKGVQSLNSSACLAGQVHSAFSIIEWVRGTLCLWSLIVGLKWGDHPCLATYQAKPCCALYYQRLDCLFINGLDNGKNYMAVDLGGVVCVIPE